MRHLSLSAMCSAAVLALAASFASADWDEAIDGDLSGDRFNPNAFSLLPGSFLLSATTVDGDLDYISVTLSAGATLDAIMVRAYDTPGDIMFIGVVPGPVMTVDPAAPDPGLLLGWTYFGDPAVPVGEDLLLPMSFGGTGFTPPLGAGTYSFWINQINGPTTFTLEFVVSGIPTPGAASAMMLLGSLAATRRRR